MAYNPKNNGTVVGTLLPCKKGSDSVVTAFNFSNAGTQRIALSVSVSDNFQSRISAEEYNAMPENARKAHRVVMGSDGVARGYRSQSLGFEQFLPAGDKGVQLRNFYNSLNPGDLVVVSYSVRSSSWVDQNNVTKYKQWLEIEELTLLRKVVAR